MDFSHTDSVDAAVRGKHIIAYIKYSQIHTVSS